MITCADILKIELNNEIASFTQVKKFADEIYATRRKNIKTGSIDYFFDDGSMCRLNIRAKTIHKLTH